MRSLLRLAIALGLASAQAAAAVDLTVTSVTATPTTVPRGSPVTASATVLATGGPSVNTVYVDFYLSTDANITTSDAKYGRVAVGVLGAGESGTATFTFTPLTTVSGTYYIGAITDNPALVAETNETNNATAGGALLLTKPDVVVASVTATPAVVPLGSTMTETATVTVTGGNTLNTVSVDFYLSTDPIITYTDAKFARVTLSPMTVGQSATATASYTPPASLAGTYYTGAIVDNAGQVDESNETNNATVGPQVTITKPDVVVSSVTATPTIVPDGSTMTETATVTVTGGNTQNTVSVDFYLSTDSTITPADYKMGRVTVSPMAAGQSTPVTFTFTPPASLAGRYFTGSMVDNAGQVDESNETNNATVGPQVAIRMPDLTVTTVAGAPEVIGPGDTFVVNDTIALGPAPASVGAFSVGYYLSATPSLLSGTRIGSRSLTGLAPGQSSSASTVVTVPTGLGTGSYYFGAVVDDLGQVAEASESNNERADGTILIGLFSCQGQLIDDGNPCTLDSCDPLTGPVHVPASAGLACSSEATCNGSCDVSGACTGGIPIDEPPACYVAACDPVAGLSYERVAQGTSCDDGNACTYADSCTADASCAGSPVTCASDACNQRACNGTSSCGVTALTGNACDDANACTYADTCNAGVCSGTAIVCHSDGCATRACNGTASCTVAYSTAGVGCDDGNPCTYSDSCDGAGQCGGTAVSCVSTGPCQEVQCNGTASCTLALRPAGATCTTSGNACGQVCDGVSPYCQPAE